MKKFLLALLFFYSLSLQADGTQVRFKNAWIKQLPPVIPMRAGYMSINNPTQQPLDIIAFQSDAFERIEMHETQMADGMMKMVEQEVFRLPAKSQIELKPGGKHLMLISPKLAMQIGDKIDVTVTFSDDSSQSIHLEVRK